MTSELGPIQSVKRAVDVLFCFDHETPILTAADISERLRLNRSTVWRYLQSLSETGLIREIDSSGRYALAARVVRLAEIYTSQWGDLAVLCGDALRRLRDATGETAAMHVRQGWTRVVLTQVESQHELHRTYRDIGEPVSLLLGAPSIAILAWLRPEEQKTYLDKYARGAVGHRAEVEKELAEARRRGYAVSRESRTKNIGSVAVPVLGADGAVPAAVNVSGPLERFHDHAVGQFAEHTKNAAKEIESLLAGDNHSRW